MKRWVAALPLVALGLGVVLFATYALKRPTAQVSPAALVGQPLPDLVLPPIDGGEPRALRILAADGPVLINLFASWCVPCAVEHPELMRLREAGVRIIGVAYKDKPAASAAFLAKLGNPYAEVLMDADGRAGIDLGLSGVPETFLIGDDGRVIAKHTGPMTRADAARMLAALDVAD